MVAANFSKFLPCVECPPGYGLKDGRCFQCDDPACASCTAPRSCTTCEQGFGRVRKEGKESIEFICVPCPANCDTCLVSIMPGGGEDPILDSQCTRCRERHAVQGGDCLECSPHCKTCETPGLCDENECDGGYGLQGESNAAWWDHMIKPQKHVTFEVCKECIDNCFRCESAATECDQCRFGYGKTASGTCAQCSAHCKHCTTSDDCNECQTGFVLRDVPDTAKRDRECHSCSDQCIRCNTTGPLKCDECKPEWTPMNGACVPCYDAGCLHCEPNKVNGVCCEWDDELYSLTTDRRSYWHDHCPDVPFYVQ